MYELMLYFKINSIPRTRQVTILISREMLRTQKKTATLNLRFQARSLFILCEGLRCIFAFQKLCSRV